MPDKRIHLLSAGAFPDDLLGIASGKGIEIQIQPFIQIVPFYTADTSSELKSQVTEKRVVVFTSKEAVRILFSLIDKVPEWQVFCLNGATRREVLKHWQPEVIQATASHGRELADRIVEAVVNEEVIFFCGLQHLPVIPEVLAHNSIPLKKVVLYSTRLIPSKIEEVYDGIFFYSPSGVESFFSVNRVSGQPLFAIGETTAKAIRSYVGDTYPVQVANRPEKLRMLELADEYFKQKTDEYTIEE